MSPITVVILAFSVIGALDYLLSNRFGVGREFERAFSLFCPMALSMLGMIVLAPLIGEALTPFFEWVYTVFKIDPSIIPASLFANDMGGMALARTVCKSSVIGGYNAFVISSMMGCTISFTLPFSLGIVKKEQYKELFFGLLCGIVTIPIGSIVGGLICKIPLIPLLINLLPLIIVSAIISVMLILIPKICIKCFSLFGVFIKALSVIGIMLAIFTFITKIEIHESLDTLENAALICVNACVTLSGALPFMAVVSRLLKKPLSDLGSKIGINGVSALAFLSSLVTNASTFGVMEKMDKKGTVLNSAFAVSASFVFGSHIAFTMAYDESFVFPMIVGKLTSGISAVILAMIIYKEKTSE